MNMAGCRQILGILVFIFVSTSSSTKTLYLKEDSGHENLVVFESSIEQCQASSIYDCGIRCLMADCCHSIFYHGQSKQCVTHNFIGAYLDLHETNRTISNGWKYYEVASEGIDCSDLREHNSKHAACSGVYFIYPEKSQKVLVYCDMERDGGAWTVIQRHSGYSVDFQRNWTEYEAGFGSPYGDLWLGNKLIHVMTSNHKYELRVDLTDDKGDLEYAVFKTFRVGNSSSNYMLTIGEVTGTTSIKMTANNGMKFSTIDRDNDMWPSSCAKKYGSWWHNRCSFSGLNRNYSERPYWASVSVEKSVMMIRKL